MFLALQYGVMYVRSFATIITAFASAIALALLLVMTACRSAWRLFRPGIDVGENKSVAGSSKSSDWAKATKNMSIYDEYGIVINEAQRRLIIRALIESRYLTGCGLGCEHRNGISGDHRRRTPNPAHPGHGGRSQQMLTSRP